MSLGKQKHKTPKQNKELRCLVGELCLKTKLSGYFYTLLK